MVILIGFLIIPAVSHITLRTEITEVYKIFACYDKEVVVQAEK